MLWTIALILLVLWGLGLVSSVTVWTRLIGGRSTPAGRGSALSTLDC